MQLNHHDIMKRALLIYCALFGASALLAAPAAKPNILFLLSDDQAWNGLSCRMHPDMPDSASAVIETPNIARLAGEGMRFSQAYSPASVCSPTRISLQTGKSPAQCQWTKAAPAEVGYKLVEPRIRKNIEAEETTVGELLQSAGYATAHYGKWHIGGGGPASHGYDESDGETGNEDAAPHVEPNPVDIFGMNERATAFMERSKKAGKPFFIQMSYNALHYPENATRALIEKYSTLLPGGNEKEIGAAAISEDLDRGVGELLKKLDELMLTENTYVIYMSDNGGSTRKTLSGGKGGVWEGGIRVPLIIRGPGITPDSWCQERVVGYDFFPTFCEWAGVTQGLPKEIEGGSFTSLLQGGDTPVKRPREELVFHFPHYQGDTPHTALMLGDYKLLRFYEDHSLQLYDLRKDLREANDLAGSMPEKVSELEKRMDRYLTEVHAQLPTLNPDYDPENPPSLGDRKGNKGGAGKMGRKGGKKGMEAEPRKTEETPVTPTMPSAPVSPVPEALKPGLGDGGETPRSALLMAIDTDGDSEISAEEMRHSGKTLISLDRNGSRQLESTEFVAITGPSTDDPRKNREFVTTPAEAARTPSGWLITHMDQLDLNGDGNIGRAELMNQARMAFGAFDRDANGVLNQNEYAGRQPKSPVAAYLITNVAGIDSDANASLTASEFATALGRIFTAADQNRDDKVSLDELGSDHMDYPPKSPSAAAPTVSRQAPLPALQPSTNSPREGAPNFVLILIDDMGWNAMGFTGNTVIETPRTDELARQGMIFTNAYASAPNCAPTRACLMSGQYTPRHGVYTVVDQRHNPGMPSHQILSTESKSDLATESVTIAESLKAGGYATAMFGMWNLGRGQQGPTTPTGQGFDVFKDPKSVGFDKDRYFNEAGEYLSDAFTAEGIKWMTGNRGKPFFLYMAYHDVHAPFEAKPELVEKYRKKGAADPDYAATVEALDSNIGRLVDALKANGLEDNTVVIFHSDNGGTREYIAPLAGGKGTLYEGGLRVPTAIRGPGIVAGETPVPILSMDLYPTMLELAGLQPPNGHLLDGISIVPLLTGKTRSLERKNLFWHFPCYIGGGGPGSAMRQGDWKVIEFFESKTYAVYNLGQDPWESQNLFTSEPEKSRQLIADLHAWQRETGAPRPGEPNPNYDPDLQPERGRGKREKGG